LKGPLRVHLGNPRYFTVDGERAVYLAVSHVWCNLQDMGPTDPPLLFDFEAYLDSLKKLKRNLALAGKRSSCRLQGMPRFCSIGSRIRMPTLLHH